MLAPAADLALGVAGVDQLEGVPMGEGEDGDGGPGEAEHGQQQQTQHVSTRPLLIGT